MQSNQRFKGYRAHKLFRQPSFLMAAAAIFLMDLSQKLIRSSEIPSEQPCQI